MNTFRFERLGFEITLPEGWRQVRAEAGGQSALQVTFIGDDAGRRQIHISVGALSPFESEPTLSETRAFFERYVKQHNYSQASHGSLQIQGREFFWGQYLMPQGVMVRKYSATINRVEYIITCMYGLTATTTEKDKRKAEREYDEILSTFRITGTADLLSLQNASRVGEGISDIERKARLLRVAAVYLLSAGFITASWLGWLKLTPQMARLWLFTGGILGSYIVFRDSRGAGAPCLLSLFLVLGMLVGWASILLATGVIYVP